jgi:hypothetical protein
MQAAAAQQDGIPYDNGGLYLGPPEFLTDGRSWLPKTHLTYGFTSLTSDMPQSTVRAAIQEAFALWSAVTPLTFHEVPDCGLPFDAPACSEPDIRIQFTAGHHGDPFPFDGPIGVLAHAFFPPPNGLTAAGDMHFDDAERWSANLPATGIDLVTVTAHEIGHALGLQHAESSQCPNAATGAYSLMCPIYTGPHRFLTPDDIDGVQTIYGSIPLLCIDDPNDPDFATLSNMHCAFTRFTEEIEDTGLAAKVTKKLVRQTEVATKQLNQARTACELDKEKKAGNKLQAAAETIISFMNLVEQQERQGNIPAATALALQDGAALLLQMIDQKVDSPSVCAE